MYKKNEKIYAAEYPEITRDTPAEFDLIQKRRAISPQTDTSMY